MKIYYHRVLASTQLFLKQQLQQKRLHSPVAIVADMQTDGVGSRENSWVSQEGNLFLSFAIDLQELPEDLKIESASIYYAYLLKELLSDLGSKVILKWPNDFYLRDAKIGGMITNIQDNVLICGVGLNLLSSPKEFNRLDITINREYLITSYFKKIEKKVLWKQVFSKYKLEFENNKKFMTHYNGMKISLYSSVLEDDGSLNVNGERIYSRR